MQLLYVFGQNNDDLGISRSEQSRAPVSMKRFFLNKNNNIKFIVKGGYHSLIVLEDKNCDIIYGAGNNFNQQLDCNDRIYNEFSEIEPFTKLRKRIKFINCGYSNTFIVTEDFKCYGLGVNFKNYNNNFKEITSLSIEIIKRIKQVICGGNHTALILQNGELYVHGNNSSQELDETTSKTIIEEFVKSKFDKPIIDIAFGMNHCLMITNLGEVYGSGNNSSYQLGIENNECNVTFEKVFHLKAQKVFCGYYHSFILTNDFEIYSCGWNYSGELCLGFNSRHVETFQKVNLTSITINPNDFEISVGFQHIFLKSGNEIYCGGYNGYGGLGLGDTDSQNQFVKHPICEIDKTVNEVICDGHATFFVMNEKKNCKKGQFMINNLKKVFLMKNNDGKASLSDICFAF